jgi:nucleoside-triphosphatase THEP1
MGGRKRFIISGVQGSGKTTFCQALVDLARSVGWKVAGVLSPPVLVDGQKVGIDVVDLSTSQHKRLANTIDRGGGGPKTTCWAFDEEVLSWGNQVLGNILPCDLLVVDELGPLEFERGEGWLNGILAVSDGDYKLAVVVIRPGLVEKALVMWPDVEVSEMDEPGNAAPLAEEFFRDILT